LKEDNHTVKRQKIVKKLREENAKKAAELKKKAMAIVEESNPSSNKKGKEETRPVYEDERGLKFRFKHIAPKTLNIDGVSRKIEDIIKDDAVMLELINGNSNLIEQIH
jgi:predicted secreted protein